MNRFRANLFRRWINQIPVPSVFIFDLDLTMWDFTVETDTHIQERNIIDYTDQLIENSYLATPGLFCSNPETGWFIQTRVEDYEGDGTLNIFNSLVSHKVQHIWEWNGSKFVKTTY